MDFKLPVFICPRILALAKSWTTCVCRSVGQEEWTLLQWGAPSTSPTWTDWGSLRYTHTHTRTHTRTHARTHTHQACVVLLCFSMCMHAHTHRLGYRSTPPATLNNKYKTITRGYRIITRLLAFTRRTKKISTLQVLSGLSWPSLPAPGNNSHLLTTSRQSPDPKDVAKHFQMIWGQIVLPDWARFPTESGNPGCHCSQGCQIWVEIWPNLATLGPYNNAGRQTPLLNIITLGSQFKIPTDIPVVLCSALSQSETERER